jgi:hypothetical protein
MADLGDFSRTIVDKLVLKSLVILVDLHNFMVWQFDDYLIDFWWFFWGFAFKLVAKIISYGNSNLQNKILKKKLIKNPGKFKI